MSLRLGALWEDAPLVTLYPRQFVQLFDRRYRNALGAPVPYAVVASLPLHIGRYMPTLATEVWLGQEYAEKIIRKHRLVFDDLIVASELIADSFCIKEKPNHLSFLGFSASRNHLYLLVLKSNKIGRETWVATLHKTEEQQLRSRVRRARKDGNVLRNWEQPFEE
jgi:hypothetical protein